MILLQRKKIRTLIYYMLVKSHRIRAYRQQALQWVMMVIIISPAKCRCRRTYPFVWVSAFAKFAMSYLPIKLLFTLLTFAIFYASVFLNVLYYLDMFAIILYFKRSSFPVKNQSAIIIMSLLLWHLYTYNLPTAHRQRVRRIIVIIILLLLFCLFRQPVPVDVCAVAAQESLRAHIL